MQRFTGFWVRLAALGWWFGRLCCLSNTVAAHLAAAQPELSAAHIVNAADYQGGGVTPGEIVLLFSANAGSPAIAEWHLDNSGKSAAPLGDTRVYFDRIAAPVVYSIRGQVCAIVPYQVAGHASTEVVLEYEGERSDPVTVPVVASAPAFFTLDASGKGQAAMLNETGCCNSVRNPAPRGTVVSLYGTGEGATRPEGQDAALSVPGRPVQLLVPLLPVAVTVGGVPAKIDFVRNIGLLQLNVRIPESAPVGDAVPLVLTVGGVSSTSPVTMAIRDTRRRVLITGADRNRLAAILKGAGYDVATAKDRRPVDLVIADMAMPAAERLALVRSLREERPRLKVIATAAMVGPRTLRAADLMGAQAVLRRPVGAAALKQRVRALLREPSFVY